MSSWVRRCRSSVSVTVAAANSSTNSRLGANIRPATNSSPERDSRRATMPPVRDLRIEYGVIRTYESSSAIIMVRPDRALRPVESGSESYWGRQEAVNREKSLFSALCSFSGNSGPGDLALGLANDDGFQEIHALLQAL